MVELDVLIEGYVREKGGTEYVTCTTTLIRDNGKNIIVDPGMDKPMLVKTLKRKGLSFDSINYVILTHTDTDHMLLTALFKNAKTVDPWSIFTFDGKLVPHENKIPGTTIRLLETPGHNPSHTSVIVKTKEKGTVVIAGDCFWWSDTQKQKTDRKSLLKKEDPYATSKRDLIASRRKILKIADYIIPGHGKMFKVKK